MPEFTLGHAVSGSGVDPIIEERRKPFRVQIYPIDRDELLREGVLPNEDLLLEDETGLAQRQSHWSGGGAEEATGVDGVNITGLDDLQVRKTSTFQVAWSTDCSVFHLLILLLLSIDLFFFTVCAGKSSGGILSCKCGDRQQPSPTPINFQYFT